MLPKSAKTSSVANLDLQANNSSTYNAVPWTLVGVSFLTVITRALSRTLLLKDIRWHMHIEDWLIVLSMMLDFAAAGVFSASIAAGVGRHIKAIPPQHIPSADKMAINATCVSFFASTVTKIAVASLLTRIFEPSRRSLAMIWGLAFIQSATTVISVIMLFTQCTPSEAAWNPMVHGKCWSPHVFEEWSIFASALAAVQDLVYGSYPAFVISKLNMEMQKKIALAVVFAAGAFACATEIYKATLLPALLSTLDFTWTYGRLLLWTIIETQVLVTAACIPTIAPFAAFIQRTSSWAWDRTKSSISQSKRLRKYTSSSKLSSKTSKKSQNSDVANLFEVGDAGALGRQIPRILRSL